MDVARSKFTPGPTPTSQVRTYEPQDNGYKATIRTTYAARKPTFIEYVANYDSLEYPVSGSPDEGQTMTITFHADEQQGTRIHNLMVFTRQK